VSEDALDSERFASLQDRGQNVFKGLEAFDLDPVVDSVTMEATEFTALCPITKQPDYYEMEMVFEGYKGLESKSLKLYLQQYRDKGAFAEALAAQIAKDVFEAIDPLFVRVTLHQKSRGGISVSASALMPQLGMPQMPMAGAPDGR
jgi:7-cyano-7-deazaguanine reductase